MQKAEGRRQKAPRLGLLIALLLAMSLVVGCGGPAAGRAAGAELALAGELALRAPARVAAGAPATVLVERADAPDGLAVTLVAQGSYGPLLYHSGFQGGRAEVRLPAEDTRAAGLVTLTARAGAATGEATMVIAPGAPVDPVTPLVGPRTIIADGAHWATALAIPFDAYGNPVAEGTPVEFHILRPDGAADQLRSSVKHLVAWRRLLSATRAGRTTVVVRAGEAHGPEASLVETPGWPALFTLRASPTGLPADGRQLVTLRTSPIADRYGNQMLDGTLVTFVAEAPGGAPSLIPAYTIDGVAEAQMEAPSAPGSVTVRATLYGVESAALRVSFAPGPAVGAVAVAATVDETAGTAIVEAGPLLGAFGQLVPEGTAVRFALSGPDGVGLQLEALTENGRARIALRLAELAPGAYQVRVTAGSGAGSARLIVP